MMVITDNWSPRAWHFTYKLFSVHKLMQVSNLDSNVGLQKVAIN